MFLLQHIVLSGLLSLILYPIFKEYSLLIFLGGVLIDMDHYIEYIIRTKNFSLKRAYKDYMRMNMEYLSDLKNKRTPKRGYFLHIFHTVELWVIIILISYFSKQYLFLYGVVFHMSMDSAFYIKNKIMYKDLARSGRPISLIHYYIKNHSPSNSTRLKML